MQTMINVQAKVIGKKRPLIPNWVIPVSDEWQLGHSIRLRDWIKLVVRQEVESFHKRQAEKRFTRVLTQEQVKSAAEAGKVDTAAHQVEDPDSIVDFNQAISNALTAFEDGFYYVFINGVQVEHLDEEVNLTAESQVTFLCLVPLAGG
jgi:hypothetical protein